ncbi:MAG: hypothetical protein IJL06_04795 [Kiritimatiellae bacterium]|nr:hypothetical protein [Kiritimatiellia bacterium]
MPNQENPNIRPLFVRVTQELWRELEVLAKRRGFEDVSSLVRSVLTEAVKDVKLTEDDYRLIAERVHNRQEVLDAR